MIKNLELFLLALAYKVPLMFFVSIGSLLEEIIAPIPSPLVMATAGTIAKAQNKSIFYLFLIASLASVSKTIGCWFFYILADKAENFVSKKLGIFFGFSHKEVENIGRYLNGTTKDDLVLIFLRALPIMPSTPISLACGFIKLNIFTFIRSTLIGAFIRSSLFLYLGYSGLAIYRLMINGINNIESAMNIVVVFVLAVFLGWVYFKRGKGDFQKWFKKKF